MKQVRALWDLFFTMLKIGLFTFGGGYAMIAVLDDTLVAKKQWLERREFLDVVAIAESTPGPIAINMATYIGYKRYGVLGAVIATLGVCLPSFVIIFVLSLCLDAFLSVRLVENAFRGIRVGVVYVILAVGIKMVRKMKKNLFTVLTFSLVTLAMVLFSIFAVRFSTVFYILICGAVGVVMDRIREAKRREEGSK